MSVKYKRQIDRILKKWAARPAETDAELAKQGRWPAGAPAGKGGQFAPAKGGAGGGSGASKFSSYGSLFSQGSSFPGGDSPAWAGQQNKKPAPPPPGAKPHPQVNDKGQPVTVNYPTKASDPSTWTSADKTATFTPGGKTPDTLNGVPMKPWANVPRTESEWAAVAGQNPGVDHALPFEKLPGMSVGAGLVIREPDGRVWLTSPTNAFGGYRQTFPKGTVEHGLSMQASAIKEAYEETGLQVRITGVLGDYERTTSKARFYIAERVGGTPAAMGWESQAVRLSPAKDMRKLLNMKVDQGILDDLEAERFFDKAAGPKKPGAAWTNQPRWPGGTPLGGKWKAYDGDGTLMPPKIGSQTNPAAMKKAEAVYGLAKAGQKTALLDAAITLQKQVDANTAAGKANYHAKELAKASQYANALVADVMLKPKADAAVVRLSGPMKISGLTASGGKPGGSNPGGMYQDAKGQKWLVKGNAQYVSGNVTGAVSNDRAKNEVLASKLMLAAGVGAPDMALVELEGKHGGTNAGGGSLGVASKWVDGAQGLKPNDLAHKQAVQKTFAVHAWLGNYDVLGQGYDNTVIKDGKAVNIDPGGAILFRAQGLPKDSFAKDAPEWETMRTTTAEQKAIFGQMQAGALKESAKALAAIDDETIKKLVDTHGPGDAKAKADLADTLIARRDAILAKAGIQKAAGAAPVGAVVDAPTPTPPKVENAVKPASGGGAGGIEKPSFTGGTPQAQAYYALLADKAAAAHAEGNYTTLAAMTVTNKGKPAWPEKTVNGKAMTAYHGALLKDLEAKKADAVADVAAGKATVTGADGTAWKADEKGVLQPATATAKALTQAQVSGIFDAKAEEFGGGVEYGVKNVGGKYADLINAAEAGNLDGVKAVNMIGAYGKSVQQALVAAMTGVAAPVKPDYDTLYAAAQATGMSMNTQNWTKTQMKMWDAAIKGDTDALNGISPITTQSKAMKAALLGALGQPQTRAASATAKPDMLFGQTNALGGVADPAPVAPKAAAPNFDAKKLPDTNTNAASHNPKIDAIKAAFEKGDEKALLAMNFGSNNYAAKQVALANDALAALGSVHKVSIKQKANSHPALVGGGVAASGSASATAAPSASAKRTLADLKPNNLPPKPDVMNWKGPGSPYSSKQWKNQANIDAVNAIEQAALTGGIEAVNALKFPVLNPDTGEPTGKMVSAADHPAKQLIVAYKIDVENSIKDFLNPPKKLAAFNTVSASSVQETAAKFLGTKIGQTVDKQPQDQQFGYWIALGKVAQPSVIKPTAVKDLTPQEYSAGKAAYQGYSALTKKWVSAVQSSGQINRAIDEGKTTYGDLNLKEVTKAIYKDATPVSAGSTLYRWQNMPKGMLKQLEQAQPGLVFQSQGGMCTSKSATATKHFGQHRMVIRAAPGSKMIHSHGSGGFASEQELTTIPGQRFVLLSKKFVDNRWDIEVLMLPPDENFVA